MTANLLTTIQSIAVNAVKSTVPTEYCYGTVTNANPLSIRLNESTLEISGESIVLTEPVIEKKITIQKHTHQIGSGVGTHTHSISELPVTPPPPAPPTPIGTVSGATLIPNEINASTTVVDTVLDAVCTEHGTDLPTDSNNDRIIVTTNRALEKDDKVLMLRVSGGQIFIVLSRLFEHE
jgi:hypothetical protein